MADSSSVAGISRPATLSVQRAINSNFYGILNQREGTEQLGNTEYNRPAARVADHISFCPPSSHGGQETDQRACRRHAAPVYADEALGKTPAARRSPACKHHKEALLVSEGAAASGERERG